MLTGFEEDCCWNYHFNDLFLASCFLKNKYFLVECFKLMQFLMINSQFHCILHLPLILLCMCLEIYYLLVSLQVKFFFFFTFSLMIRW